MEFSSSLSIVFVCTAIPHVLMTSLLCAATVGRFKPDQVAFLLGLRRRGPPGGVATLRLPSRSDLGGCTAARRRLDRLRGLCGQLGALHTTVATSHRTRD